MDPVTTAAIVTAVLSAFTVILRIWLRGRVQRHNAREESQLDHVRRLPAGSRVIDLGKLGMVIDVGGQSAHGETGPDDHR
jgi:hypothetical protein